MESATKSQGAVAPNGTQAPGSGQLPLQVQRVLVGVAVALLSILVVQLLNLTPQFVLTRNLMLRQDAPVLVLTSALLLSLAYLGIPAFAMRCGARLVALPLHKLALVVVAAGLIAMTGTRLVALDFGISRDEMMVLFDAEIMGSGRLLATVPPEWRAFVPALHPDFRLPVPGNAAWVSTYLPGNAAIRAMLGKVFDAAIINGAITMASLLALLGVARQIWPQRPDAWVIAVVLAASSAQVLCMAMTPFAMSTHLALNTIWLCLFLRGTVPGHLSAVGIGALATGLHQIIFHPLFVAPFILQLLFERRWRLGAFYVSSYLAIGAFWILYWQLLLAGHGIAAEAKGAVGITYFLTRVTSLLADFSFYGLETMAQNLLRFAAWQNPMLLVLLVPGMALAWRTNGVMRPLAGGIVLTITAMFILLPNQDIGWGYRYVHGLIGNAALLAALGWVSLTAAPDERANARLASPVAGLLSLLLAFSMLVLMPVHALQMRNHIAPFATAQAAVNSTRTDAVVVETVSIYYGIDLVRNDPFLRNRPLIFDIGLLDAALVRELCARMTVTVFDGRQAEKYGVLYTDPATHPEWPRMQQFRAFIDSDECRQLRRKN